MRKFVEKNMAYNYKNVRFLENKTVACVNCKNFLKYISI